MQDNVASAFICDTINKAAEHLTVVGRELYPELEFFTINFTEPWGFTEPEKLCIKVRKFRTKPHWLQVRLWSFLTGWGRYLPFVLWRRLYRLTQLRKKGGIFTLDFRLAERVLKDPDLTRKCLKSMRRRLCWVWESVTYPEFEVWLSSDKIAFLRKI